MNKSEYFRAYGQDNCCNLVIETLFGFYLISFQVYYVFATYI